MERQDVEKLISESVVRFGFVGIRKDRFRAIMLHLLCGDTLDINQSRVSTIFGKKVTKLDLGQWPFTDVDWNLYYRNFDKIDAVELATLTAAANVYIGLFRGFRDISLPFEKLCAILNKECGEEYWQCGTEEKDLTIAEMWCATSDTKNAIVRAAKRGFDKATLICSNGRLQAVRLHYTDSYNERRSNTVESRKLKQRALDVPQAYIKRINDDEGIKPYIIPNGTISANTDVATHIYEIIKSRFVYPYGKKNPKYMHSSKKSSFVEMYVRTLTPLVDYILMLKDKYAPLFDGFTKRDIYKMTIDVLGLADIRDTDGKPFFTDKRIEDYLKLKKDWSFDLDIQKDTIK